MEMIRVTGEVDRNHQLVATVPDSIEPGTVEVLVMPSPKTEDDAGDRWMAGIAHEWHDDLADPRQDIYSLTDGVPEDGSR